MFSVKKAVLKGTRAGVIATGAINGIKGQVPNTQEELIEVAVEFVVVAIVEFIRNFFKQRLAKK